MPHLPNALNVANRLTPHGESLKHYYLGMAAARRALAERGGGLERIAQVVAELEEAVHEQSADDQERLTEELTDLLYELEE